MTDIVPELLEKIRARMAEKKAADPQLRKFLERVEAGTATQAEVQRLSETLGNILGDVLAEFYAPGYLPDETLYWNIAERTLIPMLRENHQTINQAATLVQNATDEGNGIGLNPIQTKFPEERATGIVRDMCEDGIELAESVRRMKTDVTNITESFFDDWVQTNAAFRYQTGMNPQIIRSTNGNCCEWCSNLAGVYDYSEVRDTGNDVYRRHTNCNCQITFKDNRARRMQNVSTRRGEASRTLNTKEIIERRKTYRAGLKRG